TATWGTHPPCAATVLRERHVATLPPGEPSPLQIAFDYSDGSGNVLVKKAQAEPETEGGPLRWIASGKTVLNNKGKPVLQYEPYFSDAGHRFDTTESERGVGVTPILYYDALGRLIRTELPDGTLSRVVFTPWLVRSFDANDTVRESRWFAERGGDPAWDLTERRSEPRDPGQRAAYLALVHADTPSETHLDSLGREVVAIAHNCFRRSNRDVPETFSLVEEKYVTYTKLDAEAKPLWIRDARGNRVMEYISPPGASAGYAPCYDIAGNLLFQHSMDGGDRWMLMDATGQPFYAWDMTERVLEDGSLLPEQRVYRTVYDKLRRPVQQQLRINDDAPLVVERFIYRNPAPDAPDPADRDPQAAVLNLGGQIYRHYDPSGLMTNRSFDFKGNLLEATRQLASAYDRSVIHWPESPPDEAFERDTFTQTTQYDAIGRMMRLENWHRAGRTPSVYLPRYNARGLLAGERLTVKGDPIEAIGRIAYNVKGQRARIEYGNHTATEYVYDPATFRLVAMVTRRTGARPADCGAGFASVFVADAVVQDLHYWYDPVGKITEIHDDAHRVVFHAGQEIGAYSRYEYDALYRLIQATGRENGAVSGAPAQLGQQAADHPFPCAPPNAFRNYSQSYSYDGVGNILQMRHDAGPLGNWTRDYRYADDSNRLARTSTNNPADTVHYRFDIHGSMLNLANVPDEYGLHWDYRDMIRHVNLGGGGEAWYNYDAGKQRTRKRIRHHGTTVEERIYLGGMEWYRRWRNGSLVEEIETHHLFAEDQRVLIVEDVLIADGDDLATPPLHRYQYGNHLGSVGLELNGDGAVISFEEYHPYGTTAYRANGRAIAAKAKRYRYTGMERDEETGLSYHAARYFLPWLTRWGSADPLAIHGGLNLYAYSTNNPVMNADRSGKQAQAVELDLALANWLDSSGVDDMAAGFGDTVSLGGTWAWRRFTGSDQTVDTSSSTYHGGQAGGAAVLARISHQGVEQGPLDLA
ncbi:RHS repeat domain-containing protein, partial [Thiocapsa sp.]|uniref:RHS repeat domain-containing protein n=1 Tax=Thiocapsa sp. TaxID=2024551 RepID=UPI003593D76C